MFQTTITESFSDRLDKFTAFKVESEAEAASAKVAKKGKNPPKKPTGGKQVMTLANNILKDTMIQDINVRATKMLKDIHREQAKISTKNVEELVDR